MIQERARVVAVGEGYAWVETQRQISCGACGANKGCGVAALDGDPGGKGARVFMC
ncbi:MAG: SoxR reducing system RseC family protein [Candidatus Competibacteraceae bacterium]